ncbi:MAG TPA: hypothetical protein VGG64_17020 [Pirellulales bacterium]|jgi:hypothetical protein
MHMKTLLPAVALAAMLGFGQVAQADILTILPLVGGGPASGADYVTFDDLPAGAVGGTAANASGSADGGSIGVAFTPDAQAVSGSSSGYYAAPYLSGDNGTAFGQGAGQDGTQYITSGSDGDGTTSSAVTLLFNGPQEYLGLLWGSVDLYNTLNFYNGSTFVGSISGGDVNAVANGDQGANGTYYVNINSALPFDTVVAVSTQYAFEFDNVAYAGGQANPSAVGLTVAPEPGSLIVWSLLGLTIGGTSWRRRNRSA